MCRLADKECVAELRRKKSGKYLRTDPMRVIWQLSFVHWPAYAFISDDDEI